jgi:hypothetical protein
VAEQEPYEEDEITEVERDLEQLETPEVPATEQVEADEHEIREVEQETEDRADASDGDSTSVLDWFRDAKDAPVDGSRDVFVHFSGIEHGGFRSIELSQLHAPEDEIEDVERDL